jgi:hypothetical protein
LCGFAQFAVWASLSERRITMAKIFDCKEPGCDGAVDANDFVVLQTGGCSISSLGYACAKCGRLHEYDGTLFNSRDGQKLFSENGKAVKRGNSDGT